METTCMFPKHTVPQEGNQHTSIFFIFLHDFHIVDHLLYPDTNNIGYLMMQHLNRENKKHV